MEIRERINNLLNILYKENLDSDILNEIKEILNNGVITYRRTIRKMENINAKIKLSNFIYSGNMPDELEFRDYLYDEKGTPILIFLGVNDKDYNFLVTEYVNDPSDISTCFIKKIKDTKLELDKNKVFIYENEEIVEYKISSEEQLSKEIFLEDYNRFGLIIEYDYDEKEYNVSYREEIKNETLLKGYMKIYLQNLASYLFKNDKYEFGKECMRIINNLY